MRVGAGRGTAAAEAPGSGLPRGSAASLSRSWALVRFRPSPGQVAQAPAEVTFQAQSPSPSTGAAFTTISRVNGPDHTPDLDLRAGHTGFLLRLPGQTLSTGPRTDWNAPSQGPESPEPGGRAAGRWVLSPESLALEGRAAGAGGGTGLSR